MKTRHFYNAFVVFCVAASGLLLQIVQTRIYAVVFWNHLVYFIISIALLGFGISGTWLAFGSETRLARFLSLRKAAFGFVLTAVLSSLVLPRISTVFEHAYNDAVHLAFLLLTYSVASLPYFFGGWILGVVYRDHANRIHLLYFADLVGAGLGCLAVVVLLQPLGAATLVLLACALTAAPILLRLNGSIRNATAAAFVFLGLGALFWCSDALEAGIVPGKSKGFNSEFQNLTPGDRKVLEFSEWNLLARTDVVGTTRSSRKLVMIDGDAFTEMPADVTADPVPPPMPKEQMHWPYALNRNFESVLVIGSGGGPDLWAALRSGVSHIDAVDINPTTTRIVRHEYDTFLKGLFNRPEVRLWNEEGRSFVRSRPDTYNMIMISGIDTFAAANSGAYVLAENYLYTVNAVQDFVTHLKPEGVLCITRWDYAGESPRLFAVMLEALYHLGYSEPNRHIAAQVQGGWEAVLVSPSAFTDEDMALLVAPLGILMGMPFPTGIRSVAMESRDAVPWMWGVNGGATVLGSIAAVALAIRFNFTTVLLLAGAGYALALCAYVLAERTSRAPIPIMNIDLSEETELVAL